MPKQTPKPFDWFGPDSVKTLADQIASIGADKCRLEVFRNEKDAAMLQVRKVGTDGKLAATTDDPDPPPINNSFVCPPVCGG